MSEGTGGGRGGVAARLGALALFTLMLLKPSPEGLDPRGPSRAADRAKGFTVPAAAKGAASRVGLITLAVVTFARVVHL